MLDIALDAAASKVMRAAEPLKVGEWIVEAVAVAVVIVVA